MPTYDHYDYSPHALAQMQLRRIKKNQVEKTINHPHNFYRSRERFVAERTTSYGNTLRVVYTVEPNDDNTMRAVIITAIRISRPRRQP